MSACAVRIRIALLLGVFVLPACAKPYRVGDRVLVEWENNEYPASVLSLESPGRLRVHFEGYDSIWDETVPATRIKGAVNGPVRHPPPPSKIRARMLASASAPTSVYKAGERVRVQWKESWYPAVVVTVLGGENYRIHYEGYDGNWDENVDSSRIQRR